MKIMFYKKDIYIFQKIFHTLELKNKNGLHQLSNANKFVRTITDQILKPKSANLNNRSKLKFSSVRNQSEELLVKSFGEPRDVISKTSSSLPEKLENNQVLTKVLAAPINPADINTIQGVYAIKPDFPFVPGNEGVMEVVEKGSGVTGLKEGDHVIPKLNAMGTWRSAIIANEDQLIKIPPNIDVVTSATIAINPCTAYRMLTDFVPLKEGDVVIQNGANSAVGQAVIQIAAAKGVRTINLVRDRPKFDLLKEFLLSLGATMVIPDAEIRTRRYQEAMMELPKPVLALNGISGKSSSEILRFMDVGGTMVTYGGMSRAPLTVGVGTFIFNDISLRGFWMTRWNSQHKDHPERRAMLDYLFDLSKEGKFRPPEHDLVPFMDYRRAIEKTMPAKGMVGKKQILIFD